MFVFGTVAWGTFILLATLIVGPWLAMQFESSFPQIALGPIRYAGILLIALGVPLAIYCTAVLFIPGKSRPAPYVAGGTFIIAGPYRYVRNPFMLGVILTLWGEAVLMSNTVMFAYAAVFTWCIHFWVVFFEEPALVERLGGEYRAYKKNVPRWLPRFRKYQV